MKPIIAVRLLASLALIGGLVGCTIYRTVPAEARADLDPETSAILFTDESQDLRHYHIEPLMLPNGSMVWSSQMQNPPPFTYSWYRLKPYYDLIYFCESIGGSLRGYDMSQRRRDGFGYKTLGTRVPLFEVPGKEGEYKLCENPERPLYLFRLSSTQDNSGIAHTYLIIEWSKDVTDEQLARDAKVLDLYGTDQ